MGNVGNVGNVGSVGSVGNGGDGSVNGTGPSTVGPYLEPGRLRGFLHGLAGVDEVGAAGRAAMLATRSVKASAKAQAIDLAISMVDLTTLEGMDTAGKVRALCAKALRPDPTDPGTPSVAAV
ncbi:MAG: hypothetical protein ACKOE2_15720, partial [Actinomycetales bacterium]